MKKNSTMRLAALLLVLTLVTSCFVGGTFAKYTAGATVEAGDVTVAQWAFEVDGTNIATTTPGTVEFNLFESIKDTAGADENDVADGKIAPGTSGEFKLEVKNSSEVSAKYTITFDTSALGNIPLKFAVDSGNFGTLSAISSDKIEAGQSVEYTVKWMWDFNSADTVDNPLGIAASTGSVSASITAEQVD